MNGTRRLRSVLVAGTIAAWAAAAGCVDERCFEDSHCPAPKVCSPEGRCVWKCVTDPDCGAGFVCRDHVCVPGGPGDDVVVVDAGKDAVAPVPVCPGDMVLIEGTFCVDVYEASRPDATATRAGTDGSRAVSQPGVLPWRVDDDNRTAQAACEAAGKRLCSPEEWEFACRGPNGTVYGYGNSYNPVLCNGIDTYPGAWHLEPTGHFPVCTNGFGVFDMNGNLWEHVRDGSGKTVRGGAYNCADSEKLHRCDYVPGNWVPSALGFRCCRGPDWVIPGEDAWQDVAAPDVPVQELPGADVPATDVPDAGDGTQESGCVDPPDMGMIDFGPWDPGISDPGPTDPGFADPGHDPGFDPGWDPGFDPGVTDPGFDPGTDAGHDPGTPDPGPEDPGSDPGVEDPGFDPGTPDPGPEDPGPPPPPCPEDMVRIRPILAEPGWCMDRYEASRADATSSSFGTSAVASSRPGVLPWYPYNQYQPPLTLSVAQAACQAAGKRLCTQAEWSVACYGTANTTYTYGNDYNPTICNGIDVYCFCKGNPYDQHNCDDVAVCPYPKCYGWENVACRAEFGSAGKCGPCYANFHVEPTGRFPGCVNEWGAYDIHGNVWEMALGTDGLGHFRGGAYNCGNSEALHRCDADYTSGVSAQGFRCCKDVTSP